MFKKIVACVLSIVIIFTVVNFSRLEYLKNCIYLDDSETVDEFDSEALYEELFDPNSVVKIDVNISRSELAKMQQDYEYYKSIKSKSPIYRMAESVTFDINGKRYVIEEVGIRMKGSTSQYSFYNDIVGIYNLVNFKLSFNETFDESKYYSDSSKEWSNYEEREQRKNRTFATLEKLDVKWNSNMDNTYSRNQYASDMLKDYGMFTQKCSLASFSMGGGKLGVYKILEPVDEIFIQRYFPEEDWGGDLYKAHWSYKHPANYHADSTYGIVNKSNTEFYQFDLQTNEESSDYADLKNLLEVINQEDVTRQDLESVIDMDYFIRFCALNYMIGNQDDMRNNYNNHYVYFRASDGKAVIIPIDLEICLGDTYAWNPSGNGCTDVSPYSDISVGTGLAQENPLINLTVTENGFYKDEYTAYLLEISESKWMTVENYQNYYEIARKNYSDEIISSYRYCSTWGCNLEFSMNGGEEYNGNMAVGEFMSRIKQTVYEYAGE